MLEQWIWLAPVLPWLASAWILLRVLFVNKRGEAGERQTAVVLQIASLLPLILLIAIV